MTVLGIDVSHHNGAIDWVAVARGNVHFAFTKASDGSSFVDPQFSANWAGMREAGVLRGAYHFARPGGDPDTQAARFASLIGPLSWGELPPALDLEVMDGLTDPRAVVTWAVAFVQRAEALLSCKLIVYTGGLWRHQLGNPPSPELSTRLLWTARYSEQEPVLPTPWNKWTFWQFTDGQSGRVQHIAGVSGLCDCDYYAGELSELQALSDGLANSTTVTPPPAAPVGHVWPGRTFVWPAAPTIRGPDVAAWQKRIATRGFTVTADGIYGPQARTACIAFQRHAGLEPNGIVGRATWTASFDAGLD